MLKGAGRNYLFFRVVFRFLTVLRVVLRPVFLTVFLVARLRATFLFATLITSPIRIR